MHYECAMLEIETKLNVFDKEFSLHGESNPIESISTRLKNAYELNEQTSAPKSTF